jgi:hypothetical protein
VEGNPISYVDPFGLIADGGVSFLPPAPSDSAEACGPKTPKDPKDPKDPKEPKEPKEPKCEPPKYLKKMARAIWVAACLIMEKRPPEPPKDPPKPVPSQPGPPPPKPPSLLPPKPKK